ncbi:MAG: winged helix-turn-helix transcriptional regulator [Elusimicrobia bacterium]|jgi:ArsR family transcriptional regulator|nr:metalloregulator ArsR/SmtB family transcription factor [Candidatus Omnitrophota bacterium]MDD5526541.1 metalloregulator ArsR/SmtB family transcription factor [Candidatus Omnitrophota bacterium]NLE91147.1 winged helix-turn-helix transcriptional regulator [Elusimicrobiota bacterium]
MENSAYQIQADFVKALAHPVRLQIIEALQKGEQNVGSIAKSLHLSQPALSRQLTVLKDNGILGCRQQGLSSYYKIEDEDILKVLKSLRSFLCKKLKKTEGVLKSLERE